MINIELTETEARLLTRAAIAGLKGNSPLDSDKDICAALIVKLVKMVVA